MTDELNGLDMRDYDGRAAQSAWARRNGLRESRAHACPRVVAGKRCLRAQCICSQLRGRTLDHVRIWADGRGGHVLTAEPYDCTAAKVAALAKSLEPLGLHVEASTEVSPWYPGRTTLIIVRSAGRPEPKAVPGLRPVTWADVEESVRAACAFPVRRTDAGRRRRYEVTFPWSTTAPREGNDFLSVSVQLNQRWSQVVVDRIGVLPPRPGGERSALAAEAGPWYAENIAPFVAAGLDGCGVRTAWWSSPQGDGVFQTAAPVRRQDVPQLLRTWIPQEVAWAVRTARAAGVPNTQAPQRPAGPLPAGPVRDTGQALRVLLESKYNATRLDKYWWHVPLPGNGAVRLFCKLNPRRCNVTVERRYSHANGASAAHLGEGCSRADEETVIWPWLEANVWPHVSGRDALHCGGKYGETFRGIERAALLEVLDAWLAHEAAWGVGCDQPGYCLFCGDRFASGGDA